MQRERNSLNDKVSILTSQRLRLRPFVESDRDALRAFQIDPETMSTYGAGIPLTKEEADRVLKYHIECQSYPYWAWAVTLPADDKCFGQVTARWSDYKGEKWIELGWILNKETWGKGYGPEAVSAVLQHGMKDLHWRRAMAGARDTNRRSTRLMEKAGMRFVMAEPSPRGPWMRHVFEIP